MALFGTVIIHSQVTYILCSPGPTHPMFTEHIHPTYLQGPLILCSQAHTSYVLQGPLILCSLSTYILHIYRAHSSYVLQGPLILCSLSTYILCSPGPTHPMFTGHIHPTYLQGTLILCSLGHTHTGFTGHTHPT